MTDLKNKKLLIIVESPNKCTTISNILKKAGYINTTVAASYGHIMELSDGGNYYNSGIDPENNFELQLKIASDKNETVRKLKAQAREADAIYLCSDDDREGSLIAWSLIKFLGLEGLTYYRAVMHEITPKAVVHAIENPIQLSTNLVEAALARLTIDKMIGYTLSPIAKAYVGARSVGRCQSAGLKLIVDREKEIRNFEPEEYYELYLNFTKNETTFKAKYIGTEDIAIDKIKTTEQLENIMFECTDKYRINDIQTKQKKELPKPPFCTATFQQEASTKLGLKVKDAMNCAQKLFEGIAINGEHKGLITYMRTDSTSIAKEFLPELKEYVTLNFGAKAYRLPKTGPKATSAQEGHEALRVVDINLTPEILEQYLTNDLLLKVYKLIWQRTLAAVLPEAVISETSYIIENNHQLFKLVSNELLSLGYRVVYGTSEKEDAVKETFSLGEELMHTKLQEQEKQTQPPSRYKEASLIKELQKREIGRPSTYVTIVETVLSPTRGYCEMKDKIIIPTERGIQLAGFLDRSFSNVISLDYTKILEESLDQIAAGKLKKLDFLAKFHQNLETSIKANKETAGDTLQEASKNCPKCGAPTVVRRSRFGKLFHGCSQYPACNGIINI